MEKHDNLNGKRKEQKPVYMSVIVAALIAASILFIPLIAMQFTKEVNWSIFDFIIAWILLFSATLTYKLVSGKKETIRYRMAVASAVATGLFLVWSNLAVGLIGSENNPANLMYLGVLVLIIAGSFIARFQPNGMTRVLMGAAFIHALIAVIALLAGMDKLPGSSVLEIIGVNGFFAALWIGSALLFRFSTLDLSQLNETTKQ